MRTTSKLDVACKEIYRSFRKRSPFPYPSLSYWIFSVGTCALFLCSYVAFLFASSTGPRLSFFAISYSLAAVLAISLGHQGYHGVLFRSKFWNRRFGTLCFLPLGIDGPLWRIRHLRDHHPHPNTRGHDADLDNPSFFRLAPYTERRAYHRFQHLYAPLLYSVGVFLTIVIDDSRALLRELRTVTKGKSSPLVIGFLLRKLFFVSWWFALPMFFQQELGATELLILFLFASIPTAWIFLPIAAAHLNTHTTFFESEAMTDFSQLQAETTVDFGRDSLFLTYLYGGLNCHLAHHVWPAASCSYYPAMFSALEHSKTLGKNGGKNLRLPELIRSHLEFLRQMGCETGDRVGGTGKLKNPV